MVPGSQPQEMVHVIIAFASTSKCTIGAGVVLSWSVLTNTGHSWLPLCQSIGGSEEDCSFFVAKASITSLGRAPSALTTLTSWSALGSLELMAVCISGWLCRSGSDGKGWRSRAKFRTREASDEDCDAGKAVAPSASFEDCGFQQTPFTPSVGG
eukprot:3128857-Amphidinium_carterae.2